jgi:hypothetical protein
MNAVGRAALAAAGMSATGSLAHGFGPAAVPDGVIGTLYVLALACGCACFIVLDTVSSPVWIRRATVALAVVLTVLAFAWSFPPHA